MGLVPVLEPQPIRDFLGVKTDRAANPKARELTSCRHAVDVLVIHSQKGCQVRDLHRSVPGFELLYQIETHGASSSSAVAHCLSVEL